ncbi:MAG: apolipoprotein A1/A4/E family protein [Desulfobulbaceae bacterium]|nr:apolipoprotein A1/A4/E family protein [Desulfobulbaceae bacterium]
MALKELLEYWKIAVDGAADIVVDDATLAEWKNLIGTTAGFLDDRDAKLGILQEVSKNPLFGIYFLTHALPEGLVRSANRLWGLLRAEQTSDGANTVIELPTTGGDDEPPETWNIKQLEPPSVDHKYVILSDIHRDTDADDMGDFQIGSVDHFTANKNLYLKVLNYADHHGYTVIEGGDCEELWAVGRKYPPTSGKPDPQKKLKEAIQTHHDVYAQLASMHAQDRYVRVQGNHDSFIKPYDPANGVFDALQKAMGHTTQKPFVVYDGCVIPGVKSMQEHTALDLIFDGVSDLTSGNNQTAAATGQAIAQVLIEGHLGLTAKGYTETTTMFVCHGHQFDFWNNPDSELIGLILTTAVGVPIDEHADPLLDIGGIAMGGSPLIDFESILASLPLFNSWYSKGSAVGFAHGIQHRSENGRLSDTPFFLETVPTLWGAIGVALSALDQTDNTVKTPAESRAELGLGELSALDIATADFAKLRTYFQRHYFNHICLGHTHGPHSQPFATVDDLKRILPPLAPVLSELEALAPGLIPQLKTGYFNSGTAGWWEGVIWAVIIDETGQARLSYWTDDCDADWTVPSGAPSGTQADGPRPNFMDWELTPDDGSAPDSSQLEQAIEDFIGDGFQTANKTIQEILEKLAERIEELTGRAGILQEWLGETLSIPIDVIGTGLLNPAAVFEKVRTHTLEELEEGIDDASDAIRSRFEEQLDKIRNFTLDVFSTAARTNLLGVQPSGSERISITIPYGTPDGGDSFSVMERLKTFFTPAADELASGRVQPTTQAADHLAAFAYSILGGSPSKLPFFTTMDDPLVRIQRSSTPVLQALLSTLWMFPLHGHPVQLAKVKIESTVTMKEADGMLAVVVEFKPPDRAPDSPPPDPPIA